MTEADLAETLTALKNGAVIIYPTDTLYALGADIFNKTAIETVFSLKHRPSLQPLPIAVDSLPTMTTLADMTPLATRLATRFLPGPLTLILHKKPTIPPIITSGHETIAIRIPRDPTALTLLHAAGPLTATSANIHNHPTPATVPEIKKHLNADLPALDRGPRTQTASTIIDLTTTPPRILRHGPIPADELHEALHG